MNDLQFTLLIVAQAIIIVLWAVIFILIYKSKNLVQRRERRKREDALYKEMKKIKKDIESSKNN